MSVTWAQRAHSQENCHCSHTPQSPGWALSHNWKLCPLTCHGVLFRRRSRKEWGVVPPPPECRVSPWDSYALEAHLFVSLCFGICFCFPFILIFFQSFIYFNMGLHIGLSSNTTLFCHSAFHFWPLGTHS